MALNDRQHVEVIAILKRVVDGDFEARRLAGAWVRENKPTPEEYIEAMRQQQAYNARLGIE
jgi:hypothetical protein